MEQILSRRYHRTHLYTVSEDLRLLGEKEDRREKCKSRKRQDAVRKSYSNRRAG